MKQHFSGCYRLTLSDSYFGQIKKVKRQWEAEIRENDTGTLVRFAGIWSSRKDAVEELLHIATTYRLN